MEEKCCRQRKWEVQREEGKTTICCLISRISSETSVAGAGIEMSKDKIRMVPGVQNQTIVFQAILGTFPYISEKRIQKKYWEEEKHDLSFKQTTVAARDETRGQKYKLETS